LYESHYAQPVSKKLAAKAAAAAAGGEAAEEEEKKPRIDPLLEMQFGAGRLYAALSS